MKNILLISLALIILMGLTNSCSSIKNANKKQKGAVIGASSGAVIGGVIGNNTGDKNNSVLGAILGGVIGGAAGAYIGNRMDRQAEKIETEIPGAEVTRIGEGINVTFDESSGIYFDTGKASINAASETTLTKLAEIFKEFPNSDILIEGHTDSSGGDALNLDLSKRRAESVSNYLKTKGIAETRITNKWYGEEQPRFDNETAEGRKKNRRVELAIIASKALKEEAKQETK